MESINNISQAILGEDKTIFSGKIGKGGCYKGYYFTERYSY